MTWLQTIVLGIVEGITEFLPISSTGHMIIVSSIMGINEDDFTKLFEVCIQLGAILSVLVLFWKKFFEFGRLDFYLKLLVAFIPAAIMGALFHKKVDQLLESSMVVGVSLLVGGIILLFIDSLFKNNVKDTDKEITYPNAFVIGCFQVLAMIPGTSRSAATIVGGLQQKLTRKMAAEFSFFLAVPTMFAATALKLWEFHKKGLTFEHGQLEMLLVGNVIAFIVALIAIRTFLTYVQKHSFRAFGIYRILAALVIFGLIYMGMIKDTKETVETKQTVTMVQHP
jgi:undecaprenyl-diphosphatase